MIGEFRRRLAFLFHRRRFDRDLEDEMRFHAEMTGGPQFGNVTLLREESREMWGFGAAERLVQDLSYAVRVLRKSPAFTAVAILSLALGIGANTAIFTLINALILRSLPVQHPEELVALSRSNLNRYGMSSFPFPFFRELRDRSDLFAGVLCQTGMSPSLSVHGSAERVTGELVSGDYFDVLGIVPYAGRVFNRNDETAAGADRVVVLSYGFWKRRFGGDPAIIGQVVNLNTTPMTVIGVSPPAYDSLYPAYVPDLRVPITMQPQMYAAGSSMLESRGDWWLTIVARLKPSVTQSQAEAALTAFERNYLQQGADAPRSAYQQRVFESERVSTIAAASGLKGRAKNAKQLYVLMAVVGLVLLVACVNLANLLLARTAARQREIAVRLSLGAARGRIIRQLLTESVLLAGIGGVIGILFASWGARLLLAFLMAGQRGVSMNLAPDLRVLGFTLAISLATGILFGLAPALKSTRFELSPELKGEQPRLAGTQIPWRKVLVSAQVALSLLLVIGAGLFLRSLQNLRAVDAGFDAHNVLEVSMDPRVSGYKQEQMPGFYRAVAERVSHLPAVISASFADIGLIADGNWGSGITVEGYQPKEGDPGPNRNVVGPGYFTTLRIPLLRGRDFVPRDVQNAPHVAIVNESFARFYFGQQNPLGKHIGPGSKQGPADYEIVGVAKDGKYASLREEIQRFWYIPYEQHREIHGLTLYARTTGDPLKQASAVRQAIRSVDPNVPSFNVGTLEEQIDNNIAMDRMIALSSSFFSFLAALIAAIGLYGVMTYSVVTRKREIGIRMALGARQTDVVGPILRDVAIMFAAGLMMGVPCALLLGKFVATLLFELRPADPEALFAACGFMGIVALVAGYLPARRAARIDPMIALRYE